MKKFNEFKERVFKIRVVNAPAGVWYESLVGSDVETNGYNQYDKVNEWRVNDNGEERLIAHNDARVILVGGFARWSTVLVSGKRWGSDKRDQVATLCGENLWGNLQVNYVTGGQGVCNPEDIIQVLDEGKCFDESGAYTIATFFDKWKNKEYLVCPNCKSTFEFYSFSDKKTLKCSACLKDNEEQGKGIRLDRKLFNNPWISLTDEDINKHNSEVLFKHFKNMFKRNGAGLDPDHRGFISDSAPEGMMETGSEIKYHYDLLGAEKVQELRDLFKVCYTNTLTVLKKRDKERKERESWSELEQTIGRKLTK